MRAEKTGLSNRGVAETGSEDSFGGGSLASTLPPYRTVPTEEHERHLRSWLQGYHSRESEIAGLNSQIVNLNARCDQLYLRAYSPKVRQAMIDARLDAHFAAEADALYREWTR